MGQQVLLYLGRHYDHIRPVYHSSRLEIPPLHYFRHGLSDDSLRRFLHLFRHRSAKRQEEDGEGHADSGEYLLRTVMARAGATMEVPASPMWLLKIMRMDKFQTQVFKDYENHVNIT